MKFNERANEMSHKLRFLKSRLRDRELNEALGSYSSDPEISKKRQDYWNTQTAYQKDSLLFTKLHVLRALKTGKQHLSPNTRLDRLGLNGLDLETLKEWVEGVEVK